MRSSERGPDTHVVGSPRYMSPEQVLRKRADHRSDIFSLGVVLYEMVTGAPPFTGADLNAILHQIVNAEPAPLRTALPGLPEMLESILAKALAKAPEDRYQTARELAAELRECRKQMPATDTLAHLALPEKPVPKDPATAAAASAPASGAVSASGTPQPAEEDEVGAATDEHARTLGLSKDFDSLSATARLAAETGVLGAFASFINTASGSASTAAMAAEPAAALPANTPLEAAGSGLGTAASSAASASASPAPAPEPDIAEAWSPTQRLVFGGSVAVALVIAALIVFV
jgi:serine/threonine-protein kinase